MYRRHGKLIEEKAGYQYRDDMTPSRAARIRGERIEGKQPSNLARREAQKAKKEAREVIWTIDRISQERIRQKSLKSIAQEKSRYKLYLAPTLGHKRPEEILPLDIDRIRLRLLKTKSPATVKLVLAQLKAIVNFGAKRQLCKPFSFQIEMPTVSNEKTETLSPKQLGNLIKAIEADHDIQAGNFMCMALFTGMRRGELFKLKWEDIDFDYSVIYLRDPKPGADQKIPLNEAARNLLSNHPQSDSPFVFPGRKGGQRTEIRRPVNRIKKSAGLPDDFRPLHGLRHAYASMLVSSGQVDLYTLQKLLTHKSPVMTQRYAHLRDETLKRAADLAGDIVTEAMNGEPERVVSIDHSKES
jgi:integrase